MLPPLPPVVAHPGALRRVLLVKLSSLGDVVHALPLLDALRQGLGSGVHLEWAVRDRFAALLDGNPNLDQVSLLTGRGTRAVWKFGRDLRRRAPQGWEVALDAQGLLLSGLVTLLSGAPTRVGFDRNREGNRLFLTHPVVPGRQRIHIVDRLMGFCDALGIPRVAPRPQTYLAEAEAETARELLAETGSVADGPRVGCIIGASTPDKAWPVARWAELARRLSEQGATPVLLGGPGEAETARRVLEESGQPTRTNLVGRTPLRTLASVLARCDVVVGGDSGPTHLTVAVGTPVVGLYGVTDPVRTGPCWGPGPAQVLDWAQNDAPPETRRPRHSALTDALARIPAAPVAEAVDALLRGGELNVKQIGAQGTLND